MMAGGDVKGRTQTMARSEDRPSDDDGSDSASDRSSDYDGYDSDSSDHSSNDGSENASEDEVEGETEEAAAKKERVRAGVDEMRRMMADMDAVRARLQLRFTAERQARQDRLAREDRECEEQDAARRRGVEEARARQVEASVQTDAGGDSQLQVQPSQCGSGLRHLAPDAASAAGDRSLSAVDGGAGFADAVPNKAKPAGLSLYDLVKASGFNLSRKTRSPARQEYPPAALSPTCDEHELAATKRQEQTHEEGPGPGGKRDWDGADSQPSNDQDSVLGGHTGRATSASRHHAASVGSARSPLPQSKDERFSLRPSHRYDENSSSASNSFASSGAGNQAAVLLDLTQQRDYRFNAAALLNASKQAARSSTDGDGNSGKTDEQREMEAIQCLLFGDRR